MFIFSKNMQKKKKKATASCSYVLYIWDLWRSDYAFFGVLTQKGFFVSVTFSFLASQIYFLDFFCGGLFSIDTGNMLGAWEENVGWERQRWCHFWHLGECLQKTQQVALHVSCGPLWPSSLALFLPPCLFWLCACTSMVLGSAGGSSFPNSAS